MYGDKGEVPEGEYVIPIGVAEVKRPGKDVTIVGYGKVVNVVFAAVEELTKENIDCEVIDMRTVRPIDYKTIIESVKNTNRLVLVEESWPLASIASEVAFVVQKDAFDYLDAPLKRVTQRDVPLPYAPNLVDASLPSIERIVRVVKEVMYRL